MTRNNITKSLLDPSAKRVLELIRESGRPPYETMTPEEARKVVRENRLLVNPDAPAVASTRDFSVPGLDGPIPVRIYKSADSPSRVSASEKMPALIFFHGGGWVFGDLDTHDVVCRILANGGPFTVISVDYRLAPEHQFPAAVDDAWAATDWVVKNSADLGIDSERIAVGGDSAGGNLASVVALTAAMRGVKVAAQLLLYPVTDFGMQHQSYAEVTSGFPVTAMTMQWFKSHYLSNIEDQLDWRVSPLRAKDLSGLPPTFLMTVGFDPLRDEGEAFAFRLRDAGIEVDYHYLPGQIHGFLTMGRLIPEAPEFLKLASQWLRRTLHGLRI